MPLYSTACPLPINRKIFRHRASAPFSPTDITGLSLWLKADAGVTTTPETFISKIVVSGAGSTDSNGTYTRSSGADANFTNISGNNISFQEGYPNIGYTFALYEVQNEIYSYNLVIKKSEIIDSYIVDGSSPLPTFTTTLSTTGNSEVTAWTDQSGNAKNGTGIGSPILINSGLNGKPVIEFDGGYASITGPEPMTSNTSTIIIVAKHLGDSTIGMMYEQYSSGDTAAFYRFHGADYLRLYNGVDLEAITTIGYNFKIFGAVINYTNSEIYINGSLDVTGDSGEFTPSGDYYLAYFAGEGTYTPIQIAEVIVYNQVITSTERQQVESYLNTKYAIY